MKIAARLDAPVQVKSCHLCVVSVIASVGLALHHVVPAVPEGEGRRQTLINERTSLQDAIPS